ncbi:MAG: 4Fe-4S binding protein [Candidatus Accumulibacter sp.]|jgi:pyruvate ferredoxin oxidoreductase delta subunit|nr:4Fe-4S binding protein [Accumulibacter sp.]
MTDADKPCALVVFRRPLNIDDWPGSSQLTGGHLAASNRSWRTLWPLIDLDPCNKCNLCLLYCPDAAVVADADGFPQVDDDWCKGCGICAAECPKHCIHMVDEATREPTGKQT